MAGGVTRVTIALNDVDAVYRVHRHDVPEKVGDGHGEAVAAAMRWGLPGFSRPSWPRWTMSP
jgi:hypothetical protein